MVVYSFIQFHRAIQLHGTFVWFWLCIHGKLTCWRPSLPPCISTKVDLDYVSVVSLQFPFALLVHSNEKMKNEIYAYNIKFWWLIDYTQFLVAGAFFWTKMVIPSNNEMGSYYDNIHWSFMILSLESCLFITSMC